ncbi:MAG: alpha/beta hydrolase [Rhodococcus sp. (in: high G+C Gram-positive bacteria)]|uniref:alpha/beta hydrolase n=1 Tax=Rhodococcus sp. TaxID=1831 RepID=UPI002ADA9CFE|nr:alpha/beta hydrolase [Rhodococcus sp. (in: high G+C Gram-positive bacteria)]
MFTVCRRVSIAISSLALLASFSIMGAPATQALPALPPGSSATGSIETPAGIDSEVTFESRGITFYGSLRSPSGVEHADLAVLLLPGSGPTDRNGNQENAMVFPNTLAHVADTLAAQGIPSLRFDKFGSGRTGLAGTSPDAFDYGFDMQVDDAHSALDLLGDLTSTPATRTVVLGHSEGALTALALQQRTALPLAGLGLLQPLSQRYLDLLSHQVNASRDRTVQGGQLSETDADAARDSLARTVQSLRESGTIPADQDPLLETVGFVPANARFLSEADRYDPAELAAALSPSTPVLITCSEKDLNVSCDQVRRLHSAASPEATTFLQLTTANHGLGDIGVLAPGQWDAIAPVPLSGQFTQALSQWMTSVAQR